MVRREATRQSITMGLMTEPRIDQPPQPGSSHLQAAEGPRKERGKDESAILNRR